MCAIAENKDLHRAKDVPLTDTVKEERGRLYLSKFSDSFGEHIQPGGISLCFFSGFRVDQWLKIMRSQAVMHLDLLIYLFFS